MNEERISTAHLSTARADRRNESGAKVSKSSEIGLGKKIGLYGGGVILLGLVITIVVAYLVGYYAPLAGSEVVGP